MSAYGSTVSDVMVKGGTRCRLDTVTYTSPEFDELETLVEVCEPLCETEKLTGPGIGPTAWLFGLPILWFVSGVPGGISVRDALPRSTARHPE